MNKKKVIIISIIILVLIIVAGFAFIVLKKENNQKELDELAEKYGSVERETVNNIIEKFNTEIKNGEIKDTARDVSTDSEEGLYWYVITENISCYVRPVEFTGSYENDNAELISLYFDKEGFKEETAIYYWKKLIKANNTELTDEEINTFIENAKKEKNSDEMTANGKGLYASIVEIDNHYEYQVKRLYN